MRLIRQLRVLATQAQDGSRSELGPEFSEVDWKSFDPRQYDPRRIVREALHEAWEDEPFPAPDRAPTPDPRRRLPSGYFDPDAT